MSNKLDKLNKQVTMAIFELESAARKVAFLENRIAELTAPTSIEGRIARRGAVRAAINSNDDALARKLALCYLEEDGIDEELSNQLKEMIDKHYDFIQQ